MASATHIPSQGLATADPVHYPALDGVRGIAVLLVLFSHAAGMMGVLPHLQPHPAYTSVVAFVLVPGWGGVDLFFVLSGFLITGILLRTQNAPRYFASFYMRRALRIFPVYYFALLGSMAVAHFVPALRAALPPAGIARTVYFFYLQNIPVFWQSHTAMVGIWAIYWSLAAEEQFYLVWPLLVRFFSRRTMLWICVVAFLAELPLRLLTMHLYFGVHVGAIQFTPNRADGLFAGAAIAIYTSMTKKPVPLRWILSAAAAGGAVLFCVAALNPRDLVGDGRLYTVGITAFALLGGALVALTQHPTPRLHRLLTSPLLRAAGKYSYGMYVYHLFLFEAIRSLLRRTLPATNGELKLLPAIAVLCLSVFLVGLVARLSYDHFEARFLRLKRFFPASGTA
jgi:peptidoglycan/LPS O-acetylase OafA/YrhL